MSDAIKRNHHHLIVGEIVFRHKKDSEGSAAAMRVNGVIIDESRDLPARLLGKSQQILQLNFHQRMQDENIEVIDVILMGFTYLGEFTQEEFAASAVPNQEEQKVPKLSVIPSSDSLEDALAEAKASHSKE